jgi:hypothetical protein
MVIYFYHALLLSAQFELFAFLVDTGMDWRGYLLTSFILNCEILA